MSPELILGILNLILIAGVGAWVQWKKVKLDEGGALFQRLLNLNNELQEERKDYLEREAGLVAERKSMTGELTDLRGEIACLYTGQDNLKRRATELEKQIADRDKTITELRLKFESEIARLEQENVELRQELQVTKLELEKYRRMQSG